MSWCADNRHHTFRAASGVDVSEGSTPSGHFGYGWVERRDDGTPVGFAAEWVDDRQQWLRWTNPGGAGWTAEVVDWPAPDVRGPREVVRQRAGGDA